MEDKELEIVKTINEIDFYKRKIEKEILKKKKIIDKNLNNCTFLNDIDILFGFIGFFAFIAGIGGMWQFMYNGLFNLQIGLTIFGGFLSIPVLGFLLEITIDYFRDKAKNKIQASESDIDCFLSTLSKLYESSIRLDNILIKECNNLDVLQARRDNILKESNLFRYKYDKFFSEEETNEIQEYLGNLKNNYNDLNKKYMNKTVHINRVNKLNEHNDESLGLAVGFNYQNFYPYASDVKVKSKKFEVPKF